MVSVRSERDLLVPSENALSACMAAEIRWSFPHTTSGSKRMQSPPPDLKNSMISSGFLFPLIPTTWKRMCVNPGSRI